MQRLIYGAAVCAILVNPTLLPAAVVINEVVYDDGGTDDREYVELFNTGPGAVDISGWTVGGQDATGANTSTAIPAATMLNAARFTSSAIRACRMSISSPQLVFWRTTPKRWSFATRVGSSMRCSTNRTRVRLPIGVLPADVATNVGPGVWGNNQSSDLTGTPLVSSAGLCDTSTAETPTITVAIGVFVQTHRARAIIRSTSINTFRRTFPQRRWAPIFPDLVTRSFRRASSIQAWRMPTIPMSFQLRPFLPIARSSRGTLLAAETL